jgi:hypothetical protein
VPLATGARLGPYEISGLIGAGGMGEVYRARDTRLGRDVAVKVLPAGLSCHPARLKRFELEARAAAALNHPNILVLHDVGRHEGQPYLVTELLEGETLREHIARGRLTLSRSIELAIQVTRGLAAAHAKGIIHRDLKPGNVLVTTDGTVKILDFGLAKLKQPVATVRSASTAVTQESETASGVAVGTIGYMAPEQVRGLAVDQRADVFAFGCLLYEMVSGQRAFQGETAAEILFAILSKDPPPLSSSVEELPPALDRIVGRCLEKRPGDRFSSAHDLGLALEAVSTGATRARRRAAVPGAGAAAWAAAKVAHLASTLAGLSPSLRAKGLLALLAGLGAVVALVVVSGTVLRQRRMAWARYQALPELARLMEAQDYWPAFLLARKVKSVVPDDPVLRRLWPRFAGALKRKIQPAGAKVLARPRGSGEGDWIELGEARGAPLPAPLGYSVFRVQCPGLEPREFAMTVSEFGWENNPWGVITLARRGELPDGMVRIETPSEQIFLGLDSGRFDFTQEGHVASFLVDAREVTNREYNRFVDAGGYQRRDFWKEPFERDGKALAWDEAMALLRDATGRPGPAAWEVGTFPQGTGDFPVTGVSWYEAAAYAAFAGKRLPSVYHSAIARAAAFLGGDFVPGSNFSGKLAPVGSYRGGLNYWGLYDAAGNAREWCLNASGRERFALGGAADDPAYMAWNNDTTKSPLDRNPTTGFRCIKPVAPDARDAELDHPVARKTPIDWEKEKPFSEDAWRTWQGLLSYARGPLDARTEWTDDTLPSWRMEKVSFAAAYGNERVVAYLFLPRNVPPPWQAVIFWPGGYAGLVSSSEDGRNTLDASYWSYLVKDGRAVVYPILKGTFERGGHVDRVVETSMYHCVLEAKDIFRSLDYLETRPDIQKDRIGYLGFSWGALAGPFVCAVEKRIKVQVLLGGGIYDRDLLGFVHRCTTPTQMVNGRADGYAESQAPMFRNLGTPADQKRHVVFASDHSLGQFQKDVVKVNLDWFDRFLGPVR